MPGRRSAGVLLHRDAPDGTLQVLIGHQGGPFWARRDERAWSVPKGEHPPEEDPLAAARREFAEEMGTPVPAAELAPLGELRLPGGKVLAVWAGHGDLDATAVRSNTFLLEWPPRSGRMQQFPEIDRARWVSVGDARRLLVAGQVPLLDRLAAHLGR